MTKLAEYIQWVGELDFDAYPFRDADALVLCDISYFDLAPVFSDGAETHAVSDCIPMIEAGEAKLMITGGDMGNCEVFELAARSKRFGPLIMSDYEDQLRADPPLQFSAVAFHAKDFSFLAYRGTDASIAGWKEDCMISFTKTEAQELSLEYANRLIKKGKWYIGGHSKGANQALFAACMLSETKWEKVVHVYLLDGPGFCPEVLDESLISRIDSKATRIIPEFDVIGKLFEPKITETKIVASSQKGILQHSLASWQIRYGDLETVEQNDPGSVWVNQLMNQWIESIPQEDRPAFIEELFGTITAEGIENLEELDMDKLQSVLIEMTGVSETTKKTIAKLPEKVLFDDALEEVPEENIKTVQRWMGDLRIQGGLLLVFAALAFFLSPLLLEVTAMGIVMVLAAVELFLTIRRLVKQHGKLEGMRERFIILIAILAMGAIFYFKEQALWLLGSMIYGILFLWLAYYSVESGIKEKSEPFIKVLHFVEGGLAAIFGIGFLLIPQSFSRILSITLAANVAIDAVLRIGYWIWKYRKKKQLEKMINTNSEPVENEAPDKEGPSDK